MLKTEMTSKDRIAFFRSFYKKMCLRAPRSLLRQEVLRYVSPGDQDSGFVPDISVHLKTGTGKIVSI